jgi:hypothetical protein
MTCWAMAACWLLTEQVLPFHDTFSLDKCKTDLYSSVVFVALYLSVGTRMFSHNFMSMASTSSRQPQDIPLPPSPLTAVKKLRKNKWRRTKSKDQKQLQTSAKSRNDFPPPWTWLSLADSTANNHPPIITKDGRYVCFPHT